MLEPVLGVVGTLVTSGLARPCLSPQSAELIEMPANWKMTWQDRVEEIH